MWKWLQRQKTFPDQEALRAEIVHDLLAIASDHYIALYVKNGVAWISHDPTGFQQRSQDPTLYERALCAKARGLFGVASFYAHSKMVHGLYQDLKHHWQGVHHGTPTRYLHTISADIPDGIVRWMPSHLSQHALMEHQTPDVLTLRAPLELDVYTDLLFQRADVLLTYQARPHIVAWHVRSHHPPLMMQAFSIDERTRL